MAYPSSYTPDLPKIAKDDVQSLKKLFMRLDIYGDGTIRKDTIRKIMVGVNINDQAVDRVLSAAKETESGRIHMATFFDWLFDFLQPGLPISAQDLNQVTLGSLNLLGNSYNAFEFMSADESFQKPYSVLREAFRKLTALEIVAEARSLGFAISDEVCAHKMQFEKNLTKEFLAQDNHVAMETRFSLICGGMVPMANGHPAFRAVSSWRTEIVKYKDTYAKHPDLLVWDIACNMAAESAKDAFNAISSVSYLNPERIPQNVAALLNPLPNGLDYGVLLGTQEFPVEGTAKYKAMIAELEKKYYKHVRLEGDTSVALIYGCSMEVESFKQSPIGTKCDAIAATIEWRGTVDEKDKKSIETTAKKTLVVELKGDSVRPPIRVVTVHAKEFKTDEGTKMLAHYLHAVAKSRDRAAVVMIDANCPNAPKSQVFSDELSRLGFSVLSPAGSYATTRKERSELHGQIYDTKKCLQVVQAHKDFIALLPPLQSSARSWTPVGQATCHPDLNANSSLLLPNEHWPADHSLLMGKLKPN